MGLTKYQIALELLKDYVNRTKKNWIWTADLKSLMRRRLSESSGYQALFSLREEGIITEKSLNKWNIKIADEN